MFGMRCCVLTVVLFTTNLPKTSCSKRNDLWNRFLGQPDKITYDIQRRFGPLNQLATNLGNFDVKSQLNNLYEKYQPLWGRHNNPKTFGSIISEISSTQPGSESMTSYTVPGSGITHITDNGSPIPSTSSSDSSKDTSKQDSSISRSGIEDLFMLSPVHPISRHPVTTFSSPPDDDRDRDRDYGYRDRDRDYGYRDRDRYRDRERDRDYYSRGYRRPRRYRYRDRERDNDPYGPYAPSPAVMGIQVGESLKSHDQRTAAASSASQKQPSPPSSSFPYPYPGYPPHYYPSIPPGVSPLSNPHSMPGLPPGYPSPFLNPIPGMQSAAAASHLHPMFSMIPPNLATTEAPTTTETPTTKPKKKKVRSNGPETILEDDGTITIAGIKPQKIVNTIAEVVTRTGLNKAIGKALTTVITQVSEVGTRVASQVVHEMRDNVQVSVHDEPSSPRPPASTVLKLGDASISFKPTRQGLSISFGKDSSAPS